MSNEGGNPILGVNRRALVTLPPPKGTNEVILPVRIDSYAGDTSALEAYFFKDGVEYGSKSVPDCSMWIAVHIVSGKIDHDLTDCGYKSLEELLKTYKGFKVLGLKESRKDAELEEARAIAEDVLEELLTEDSVLLHIEGELNLPDGAIKKAYKTLHKAGSVKKPKIDRDEVFYSLSVEDILSQAKELRIPKKKLTPEIIKQIETKIEDSMGSFYDTIQDAISEVIGENEAQTNET